MYLTVLGNKMPRNRRNSDGSRLFNFDVCAFCGIKEDNELLYGTFIRSDDIALHTNCLFFASGLCQRGKENEGFSGFLLPDIEQELHRGKKLMCSYCRKRGATIGCVEVKCKKSFHLPCGLKQKSVHQFFGTFKSFCRDHCPKQKTIEVTDNLYCHICCENIAPDQLSSCLYSPCCKNSWFHKICLQKYALSAGLYFFKCPLCNNSKQFVTEMKTHGISIPDKDASWELEENAYEELLLHPECDATVCLSTKGRKYSSTNNSIWTLLSCSYCGYHARHKTCAELKVYVKTWMCEECKTLDQEINKGKLSCDSLLETSTIQVSTTVSSCEENQAKSSVFESTSSSSSCYIKDNNNGGIQTDILDVVYADVIPETECFVDYGVKNDIVKTCNIKRAIKSSTADELSEELENSNNFEIECQNSNIKKSKTCLQDKPVNNLKDIKNISPNALSALCSSSRIAPKLRSVKIKRKVEHVCSNQKNCCIKKYFYQESGKYRL